MAEMTDQQFSELVRRVEHYARTHPAGYRLRVAALAVLGYAFVWTILLVSIVVLAGVVIILLAEHAWVLAKLAIPIVVLIGAILRALWVEFPPPDGVPVTRAQAPELFALIDRLTAALDTPRFHRVVLTDDFNAAMMQRPRLGPFGWHENWLMIGIPLLDALSLEDFQAVLAHELGHLSRAHGRFGAWVYRIRATWIRILTQLESSHRWGYQLFDWFLKSWAPYFNAYSFVLARAQEYEADRLAARLTTAEAVGRALIAINLQSRRLDHFWPAIARRAVTLTEPPAGVFTELRHVVGNPLPPEKTRRWLVVSLNREAAPDDTHPSLRERLTALGVADAARVASQIAPVPSAGTVLLGDSHDAFRDAVDSGWRRTVAMQWRAKHHADARGSQRLAELDERARAGPLNVEEAAERAQLTLALRGPEEAMGPLQAVLTQAPDHVRANFALGEILLDRDDKNGITFIERAMDHDAAAIAAGFQRLWLFYEGAGDAAAAQGYRQRFRDRLDVMKRAAPERQGVSQTDAFVPHGLPDYELAPLTRVLAGMNDVLAAFVVRKVVTVLPDEPFYVVGVEHWFAKHGTVSAADHQALANRVAAEVRLPGDWVVISISDRMWWLREKLSAVAGSQVKVPAP